MITAYFLTGSYNDQDNDFELTITFINKTIAAFCGSMQAALSDISSDHKLIWQDSQPSFLLGLDAMETFMIENNIILYSKILTSSLRDYQVDKELEGFILNRLEY